MDEIEVSEEDIIHEICAEDYDLEEITLVTAYITMRELVFGESG